ncbi:MAG TPA: type I phosphomannose isomerase catalytic subunit [Flavobacterium sp.]|jgi:mannose-6-phosphate isomerase
MDFEAYPIKCKPILKDRIWGGQKLSTLLNKDIGSETTGESWEISTVPGDISIISNGTFAEKPLDEIIRAYPDEILGTEVGKRFGTQFPLLFKYLDAREDLSIQVHPNDELAKKRHNSFGKTEMWYVMQADEGSRIIVGFKEAASPEEYLKHLEDKTLVDILDQIPVEAGDVFLLDTGTVHAIGAGIVIAEIQQTSDITYRIYDFDRKDPNGNPRQLHIEEAIEAINYEETDAQKVYERDSNRSNPMVDCEYFTTNFLPLDGNLPVRKDGSSFTVYMCVDGSFEISYSGMSSKFGKGDTVLVPAAMSEFELVGTATLLEIYIS